MATNDPKVGDKVTGTPLFYENTVTGVVIKEDAGISRDAIVVELPSGQECTMLIQSIEKKE